MKNVSFFHLHVWTNIQGYIAGNPLTDGARFDGNARIPFLHGMGIIPDELYEVT